MNRRGTAGTSSPAPLPSPTGQLLVIVVLTWVCTFVLVVRHASPEETASGALAAAALAGATQRLLGSNAALKILSYSITLRALSRPLKRLFRRTAPKSDPPSTGFNAFLALAWSFFVGVLVVFTALTFKSRRFDPLVTIGIRSPHGDDAVRDRTGTARSTPSESPSTSSSLEGSAPEFAEGMAEAALTSEYERLGGEVSQLRLEILRGRNELEVLREQQSLALRSGDNATEGRLRWEEERLRIALSTKQRYLEALETRAVRTWARLEALRAAKLERERELAAAAQAPRAVATPRQDGGIAVAGDQQGRASGSPSSADSSLIAQSPRPQPEMMDQSSDGQAQMPASDRREEMFAIDLEPPRPRMVSRLNLRYPAFAKRLGKEGTVEMRVFIESDGTVTDAVVTKGAGFGFDEEALRAIQHARFTALVDGDARWIRLAVKFRLKPP